MEKGFKREDTALVKGLAVMCMLFYHLFETYERVEMMGVDYSPLSLDTFLMISGFGNICVAVFAFLSAYGISKRLMTLENVSLKGWYKYCVSRYLKLLIGFVCIFASVNLIWFKHFDYASLYGKGWQGVLCGLLDALGLAQIAGTPTLCNTWWYMEIAIIIIFLVPLILRATKKMGSYIIIIGAILPLIWDIPFDFKRYYFVILFGVVAASEEWFERIADLKINAGLKWLIGIATIVCMVLFRQNYFVYSNFAYLVDAPIAFAFALIGKELLSGIPGLNMALRFLGKHSMNIYFVHSFIYLIIGQQFIYSFRYAGLIFVILLLTSLVYSVCLEGIKTGVVKITENLHERKH